MRDAVEDTELRTGRGTVTASDRDAGVSRSPSERRAPNFLVRVLIVWALYWAEVLVLLYLSQSSAASEGWTEVRTASSPEIVRTLAVLAVVAVCTPPARSIRGLVTWWLVGTMVVPAWVVSDWMSAWPLAQTVRAAVAASLGYCVLAVLAWVPAVRLRTPLLRPRSYVLLLLAVVAGVLACVLAVLGAPDLGSLDLASTYERRAAYKEAATFPIGYFTSWLILVLAPAAFITGLRYRSLALLGVSGAAALYTYAIVGSKNSVLLLMVAAAIYWLAGSRRRLPIQWTWPAFVLSLFAVPVMIIAATGSEFLLYAVSRRISLLTAVDAVGHALIGANVSAETPLALFTAVTGRFGGAERGSLAVGEVLRPGSGNNANSHFLSYSLQWDSLLATALVAVLAAMVLWFLDSLLQSKDRRLALTFGTLVSLNLCESYLHTALVTGGLLLAAVLMWLMPAPDEREGSEPGPRRSRRAGAGSLT